MNFLKNIKNKIFANKISTSLFIIFILIIVALGVPYLTTEDKEAAQENLIKSITNPQTIPQSLIEKNLDKADWIGITKNPNALPLLEQNPDKIMWEYLSENPNITIEIIENNLNKSWDWGYLSNNTFNTEYKKLYKEYIIKVIKILDKSLMNNELKLINYILSFLNK